MFGLGKIFGSNRSHKIVIGSPVNGRLIPTEDIPDLTFSQNILGPTIGFYPSEGKIYAPADGTIVQVFKTGHALTLTTKEGVELLIHIGINTVDLRGKGFTALVSDDAEVKKGDVLLEFDLKGIQEAGYDLSIPMVICNADDFADVVPGKAGDIQAGEEACILLQQDAQ